MEAEEAIPVMIKLNKNPDRNCLPTERVQVTATTSGIEQVFYFPSKQVAVDFCVNKVIRIPYQRASFIRWSSGAVLKDAI